jgi:hypothetical protein
MRHGFRIRIAAGCILVGLAIGSVVVLRGQTASGPAPENAPTPEQMRELLSYIDKVPENRRGDVLAAAKEKQAAEKWTQRQLVEWENGELRKIAAEEAAHLSPPGPTGDFGSVIQDLRIFSPTSGVAVTHQGIAVTDGSLKKWKGVTGWDLPRWAQIAGATEQTLYLVTTDAWEVVVKEGFDPPPGPRDVSLQRMRKGGKDVLVRKEYAFALWRWTLAGGFTELMKLPQGAERDRSAPCAFFNDKIGAYADGATLLVTGDGGKSWSKSALRLERANDGVRGLAFCGADRLAIAAGKSSVVMLALDKAGQATERWRTQLDSANYGVGGPTYDEDHSVVWICPTGPMNLGDTLQALALDSGKIVRQFKPFEGKDHLGSYDVSDGRLVTFAHVQSVGWTLRIWDVSADQPKLSAQISAEKNWAKLDKAILVPGLQDVYLILNHQRLIKWDGKPKVPTLLTSAIERPAVDTTVLAAAEDKWPPGDDPTRQEAKELSDAERELTAAQRVQLLNEMGTKRDEFENYRAQVLWMTQRALDLKAASATQTGAQK